MRFDVLTLFPGLFDGYVSQSLLKKAIDRGLLQVHLHDMRTWTRDKHHKVDDRPFGGGPGMVLRVEPVVECVEAVQEMASEKAHVVLLAPNGRRFNQRVAEEYAGRQRLILICGRYEGFDQRIMDILQPDELSVGDFVMNGGEVAAMVVVDTVLRLVPDVLGTEESHKQDSFSGDHRWLEGAQYTRPREYRGHRVPDVLLSGRHDEIARWRQKQGYLRTRQRRSDLLPAPAPQGRESGPVGELPTRAPPAQDLPAKENSSREPMPEELPNSEHKS